MHSLPQRPLLRVHFSSTDTLSSRLLRGRDGEDVLRHVPCKDKILSGAGLSRLRALCDGQHVPAGGAVLLSLHAR